MTPDQVRQIIREELSAFVKSDRFTFEKLVQLSDGKSIQVGRTNGTRIATASDQKLGFYGTTPAIQQAHTTTAAGIATLLTTIGLMAP